MHNFFGNVLQMQPVLSIGSHSNTVTITDAGFYRVPALIGVLPDYSWGCMTASYCRFQRPVCCMA
jgi:hypothetical protein